MIKKYYSFLFFLIITYTYHHNSYGQRAGSLDTTFNTFEVFDMPITTTLTQPDSKLIVVGNFKYYKFKKVFLIP